MSMHRASIEMSAFEGVERNARGVPTAFRIWRAGLNRIDAQEFVFSAESAKAILAQQAMRGNLYSIDADHLSLSQEAPPEARHALGWHKLTVRDGELWATEVEFIPEIAESFARAALGSPPEWRYFSPTYNVDPQTAEVTRYLNTALTNNPATWNVTALATQNVATKKDEPRFVSSTMAKKIDKNMMRKMAAEAKRMYDEATAYRTALESALAAFGDEGDDGDADDAATTKADESDEAAAVKPKAESDEAAAVKADEDPDASKVAASALAANELRGRVESMGAKIAALEAEKKAREKADASARREKLLAARADVSAELRAELAKAEHSDAHVTAVLASIPVLGAPALVAASQATRGETQLQGVTYHSEHAHELDRRFGLLTSAKVGVVNDGRTQIVGATLNREGSK